MPISTAPMLPGGNDHRVIRQTRIARRVAEDFYKLSGCQRETAECSREKRREDNGLLFCFAKVKEQADVAAKNVGPTIAAWWREPKASNISEPGEIREQNGPDQKDEHTPQRHTNKQLGPGAPGAIAIEVKCQADHGADVD